MRKRKLKKKTLIILLIIIVLGIAGVLSYFMFFNKQQKSSSNSEESPKVEEVVKKVKIIDLESKSRPYAVMINNLSPARPLQSGLQDAYIIYEIIVEGGLTRYMALFKDQNTERIGSVRSSRHYFLDYAMENDAYYVHWGWSPQAQSDISTYKINNINGLAYEGVYFWRDKSLNVSSEHTGFTKMELLNTAVDKLKYRKETNKDTLLNYSVDELDLQSIEGAIPANNVLIQYSKSIKSSYEYDPETMLYKRFINGSTHTDYVTKEQYTFKNIITYQVENHLISGDDHGRQTLENIGNGTGYYISSGYAVPITWEKSSRDSQTVYKLTNGEELMVNDGNTFIQIQPKGETLTISE